MEIRSWKSNLNWKRIPQIQCKNIRRQDQRNAKSNMYQISLFPTLLFACPSTSRKTSEELCKFGKQSRRAHTDINFFFVFYCFQHMEISLYLPALTIHFLLGEQLPCRYIQKYTSEQTDIVALLNWRRFESEILFWNLW